MARIYRPVGPAANKAQVIDKEVKKPAEKPAEAPEKETKGK